MDKLIMKVKTINFINPEKSTAEIKIVQAPTGELFPAIKDLDPVCHYKVITCLTTAESYLMLLELSDLFEAFGVSWSVVITFLGMPTPVHQDDSYVVVDRSSTVLKLLKLITPDAIGIIAPPSRKLRMNLKPVLDDTVRFGSGEQIAQERFPEYIPINPYYVANPGYAVSGDAIEFAPTLKETLDKDQDKPILLSLSDDLTVEQFKVLLEKVKELSGNDRKVDVFIAHVLSTNLVEEASKVVEKVYLLEAVPFEADSLPKNVELVPIYIDKDERTKN